MEIKEIKSLRKSNHAAFDECHKIVEKNILDLVKMFDRKESGSIMLNKPIVINTGSEIKKGRITTHVMMFDELKWNPVFNYFVLAYNGDDDDILSSTLLSVNNLFLVFDALVETIKEY